MSFIVSRESQRPSAPESYFNPKASGAHTPLEAVKDEMNNRAENLFYGLGHFIGKKLGTVKSLDQIKATHLPTNDAEFGEKIDAQWFENRALTISIFGVFILGVCAVGVRKVYLFCHRRHDSDYNSV